ncbi:MAG: hypothetical protein V4537_13885 [Pseudomonadota bacterium]
MPAIPHRAAVRRILPLPGIDPVHLAIRTLYVVAGLAAAVSLYSRMLTLLGDAIPAAILTLTVGMMFHVLMNRGDRRS